MTKYNDKLRFFHFFYLEHQFSMTFGKRHLSNMKVISSMLITNGFLMGIVRLTH